MSDFDTPTVRADSARNRETVLAAATRAFLSSDNEPSMRAIARDAGVGIATVYRHFPTKESLVDAVYEDQVQRLTIGASELVAKLPPADALRAWMDLFGSWLATKHGMTETLRAMIDAGEISLTHTRTQLLDAIATILNAGRATGELRPDISAEDMAASLLGIFGVASKSSKGAQANRLLDLLMDGMKVTPDRRVDAAGPGSHQ
ncbi:TetR/AcrR family transcriptional regulator [Glaciihabitans sp. UYNi722]|uniref:TetR/AcrR family transcriptional regulator n=1 Tax=Glaciihabitans sp. UYNi722 TaxID=3156344 RepID=UPI003390FB8C